jgi:UDP-GlcNAc:undecaprenyl-phosphate GlcNAc-1-phosphate transferase
LGAALAGAAAGFLIWNFPPAQVFMGDAGSHFLGGALAGLALLDGGRAGAAEVAPWPLAVLVPMVLLAVPLFDTALVAVERLRHRRPLSVGGRDHTAHRLARLGYGTRAVTLTLWALAAAAAGTASLAAAGRWWFAGGAGALAVLLALLGARLGRVAVYD